VTCSDQEGLPEYASLLAARHAAHQTELRRFLEDRWGGQNLAVHDVACGDGFYAASFDDLLGNEARVVALDVLPAFLHWASQCRWEGRRPRRTSYVAANAERLPLGDHAFDLVWCAQSLISLPDPSASLAEMTRVVRQDGVVAILENDRLHEIQLPWPPELEIAFREAERRAATEADSAAAEKPHAGRFLESLMLEAGLQPVERASLAIDRMAPLSAADEAFLQAYLHELFERAGDKLEPAQRRELQRLTSPGSPDYLPAQPSFWMTWSDVVVLARPTIDEAAE
jgi:ubiquinone/menaquinone biosynthesis C-methylase UbiE